jgi:hypothetical protein
MSAAAEPSRASTTYFTWTLGEAIEKSPKLSDIQTINDFVDHQAEAYPNFIAVGFPIPGGQNNDWTYELFSMFYITPSKYLIGPLLTQPSLRRLEEWVNGDCSGGHLYYPTR